MPKREITIAISVRQLCEIYDDMGVLIGKDRCPMCHGVFIQRALPACPFCKKVTVFLDLLLTAVACSQLTLNSGTRDKIAGESKVMSIKSGGRAFYCELWSTFILSDSTKQKET